ncbi:hypothetical protein [Arabidopsis thaliana]|nr:hypothetical protein [Arabidopsis thaliana]CAB81260.1 hypothetical protein [Arabidopsis thaliana]
MASDEEENIIPFQLQFDKPIPFQVLVLLLLKIKIAEWNPEKDLLAMVTEDSKILLHRFNWQRLWTISPGKPVTSLCWRPDGKAIAVGLEDGTISLHDVEAKFGLQDESGNFSVYEDRTSRFFPPAPRPPKMPGLVAGDSSFMDDGEDSLAELSNTSFRKFNILCTGDRDGNICFSIFGIFQIGKIVALSKDLCRLVVMCTGELKDCDIKPREEKINVQDLPGLHCLAMDTSIFWKRKYELHQVAQQASNIEDLTEVIRASLSVMNKQWADAMKTFHEKFHSLSTLIIDNGICHYQFGFVAFLLGLESSPQEEFLSLLGGARISPALNQFLVNSLGEVVSFTCLIFFRGVKRVLKSVCGTGKELQQVVLDHLQPAAEIIGFRIGELRGLSRWRARYQGIGLDEMLLNEATENTGLLLVQVQRFMMVLSSVVQQFSNFFNWLVRSIKYLMQEPNDQLLSYNSELLVVFLKFLYDQDPVKDLLELSEAGDDIEIDL